MVALAEHLSMSLPQLREKRMHIEQAVAVCAEVTQQESVVLRSAAGQDVLVDNWHLREAIRELVREHEEREDLTLRHYRDLLAELLRLDVSVLEPKANAINALIVLERQRWVDFWWREFLYTPTASPNDHQCMGATWDGDLTKPVFKQCRLHRQGGIDYCKLHSKDLSHGRWDSADEMRSCPEVKMRQAVTEAQRRARKARGLPHTEQRICAKHTKQKVHPCRMQKDYVVAEGELRNWSAEPEPLPPYPCQLCNQSFATWTDFQHHVQEHHHGADEYAKRLFFLMSRLEGLRPGKPQLWRHTGVTP